MTNPVSTADPQLCWVVSDGRRGIENQALGLAQALSRTRALDIKRHTIDNTGAFKTAPPRMQFTLRSQPSDYGFTLPPPSIVIGCGRQAIAPLLSIKAAAPNVFTCYIQDPHIETERFDLVIAPEHDNLVGDNVETMIGAPNRVTRDSIIKSTVAFEETLDTVPMPRIAMLIGGASKSHKLSKKNHDVHINAAMDALTQGYSLLITASRRTPDWVTADYAKLSSEHDNIWFYDGTQPDNPYFAFLGGADIILATEDSTNMLTEACATGKPVFTLPMSGNAGKFQTLYDSLLARCHVQPYHGTFAAQDYTPLHETDRIATQFWAHFDMRAATLN